MSPYDRGGGSIKNRRVSARYADNVLERASGNKMMFFMKTSDGILKRAGNRPNLIEMARTCGALN